MLLFSTPQLHPAFHSSTCLPVFPSSNSFHCPLKFYSSCLLQVLFFLPSSSSISLAFFKVLAPPRWLPSDLFTWTFAECSFYPFGAFPSRLLPFKQRSKTFGPVREVCGYSRLDLSLFKEKSCRPFELPQERVAPANATTFTETPSGHFVPGKSKDSVSDRCSRGT